ncbi:MAG: hypothetical protein IKS48_07755 [Eubacterium sp.]|nr:hypothetical protein [Eubacterium sp.]
MQNKQRILTYGFLSVFIFIVFTLFFGFEVHAEDVNVTIALSPTEANVGDTVTATVNINGESLANYSINISYTTGLFTCSTDEDGSGTITIYGEGPSSTTLYLVAQSEGRGSISTNGYAFYDVNGAQLSVAHAGAAVNIGLVESSENAIKISGDLYTLVDENHMPAPPENFELDYITYNDEHLYAYKSTRQKLKIVSLQNADGEQKWFVFDEKKQEFTPYIEYDMDGITYIVMNKPDDVNVPEGYSETSLTLDGYQVTAYSCDSNESIYLVYGLNPSGNPGLYLYDIREKGLTRYDTVKSLIDAATELNAKKQETTIVVNEPTTEKHTPEPIIKKEVHKEDEEKILNEKNLKMFLYLVSVLFIVMCVVVIILVIKIGLLQSEIDGPEEDEDEDDSSNILIRAKNDADEKVQEEPQKVISRNKGYAINEDTGEILVEEAEDNNSGVKVPPAVDKPDSKIENAMKERPFGIDSAFNVVSSEDAPEGENVSREPEPEEPIKIDEEKLRELRSEELKRRLAEEASDSKEENSKEEAKEEVISEPVPEKEPEKVVLPGSINDDEE